MATLGDYQFKHSHLNIFDELSPIGSQFEQLDQFFRAMVEKIQGCDEPAFLLPALLRRFSTLELHEPMAFFEFWLNQFSNLELVEQMQVRGKIVGKNLPREAYQLFFPIGMNKFYPGTHFISAHLSPDIDTTVASFLGWMDAFGAKVSSGQHIWSLPGGISDGGLFEFFEKIWGKNPFGSIARTTPTLRLSAIDLLTREGVEEVGMTTSMTEVDPELHKKAILLVDKGRFLGSWQSHDANSVRPVIFHFKVLLRQFESSFYTQILRFFADPEANMEKYARVYEKAFNKKFDESDLTEEEKERLNVFLKEIMGVKMGLDGSFKDLGWKLLESSSLFDADGKLQEDRTLIFKAIEELIAGINHAVTETDNFADLLTTAVSLKAKLNPHSLSPLELNSTIEEIRTKMESQDYLVILMDGDYPLGIIPRNVLSKTTLGTVSLRDFSNFEEVHMASYLNVISVIDHHKSALQTMSPPLILVGDVQSCNTLMAEQLFQINERYKSNIHPERALAEYFSCLYAILDDTDFLSKVSSRDVICVAKLLNELKKLTQESGSSIQLDLIKEDDQFAKEGAKRILKNDDMRSIYEKIIFSREEKTKAALLSMDMEFLLSDTKEQNGCARIGQTKLFPSNFPLFLEKREAFQIDWIKKAKLVYKAHGDIALHIQMISTIPSSNQLYSGQVENDGHLDELWFWIPNDSSYAENLLATFLNCFLDSPGIKEKAVKIALMNDDNERLKKLFQHNFLTLPFEEKRGGEQAFAVLYIKAGTLNSRKSMVSPYLPRKV